MPATSHPPADTFSELEQALMDAFTQPIADDVFDKLAMRIHRYQQAQSPVLAQFYAQYPPARHWHEIRPLPQSAFKLADVCCFDPSTAIHTFHTSGTTGETRGRHHYRSMQLHDASVLLGWKRLDLPHHRRVILAPSPTHAPHSSLSHMLGLLADSESDFCMHPTHGLDRARIEAALDGDAPLALLGTALAFLHFFENSTRTWQLPHGSYAMETGGYKGSGRTLTKQQLLKKFTEVLGLSPDSVINEYGMTELSSQFYTRGLDQPHVAPSWVRVRLIDPESDKEASPGGIGRIAIYDLANAHSNLALQTEDLAIAKDKGFLLLGRDPAALPRGCSREADAQLS